jgi:hypothetical protein
MEEDGRIVKWAHRASWAALAAQVILTIIVGRFTRGKGHLFSFRLFVANFGPCTILLDLRAVQTGWMPFGGVAGSYRNSSPFTFWSVFLGNMVLGALSIYAAVRMH